MIDDGHGISLEAKACPEHVARMPAAILIQTQATRLRQTPSWRARLLLQFPRPIQHRHAAFTLAELLISVGIIAIIVLLVTQLLKSAATVTTLGHKRMDSDSQARQLLDRMAIDFAQMVKRSDVDYYLKSPGVPQTGNDQMAFFTASLGYFGTVPSPTPSSTTQSPLSLVSYRVNSNSNSSSYNRLERLGTGLAWNGFSSGWPPVMFLPQTITANWPSAVSTSAVDSNYEVIGPQVFRFEYYYLVRGQFEPGAMVAPTPTPSASPPFLSTIPWDTTCACPTPTPTPTLTPVPTPTPTPIPTPLPSSLCCHLSPNGMQDVVAIVIDIAVIDPKSKTLLDTVDPTGAKLKRLNGADGAPPVLVDYAAGMASGQLRTQWRAALDANTVGLPLPAISGIRVYERYFYLSPPTLNTP